MNEVEQEVTTTLTGTRPSLESKLCPVLEKELSDNMQSFSLSLLMGSRDLLGILEARHRNVWSCSEG